MKPQLIHQSGEVDECREKGTNLQYLDDIKEFETGIQKSVRLNLIIPENITYQQYIQYLTQLYENRIPEEVFNNIKRDLYDNNRL